MRNEDDEAPQERTIHFGQDRLLLDDKIQDHVIVAGVGYGKTKFGPMWHFQRVLRHRMSRRSLVVAPTYKLVELCLDEYIEFLRGLGLEEGHGADYRVYYSTARLSIVFPRGGIRGRGSPSHRIDFLSGHKPANLVGYNISHAWIDEAALCVEEVRRKVLKRLRCPKAVGKRQVLHTTTPEGTNWFYERFGPHNNARVDDTVFSIGKALVLHGSSFDNPYLDDDFRKTLTDEFGWDKAYFENYVLGLWSNLSKSRFYFAFSDSACVTPCLPDVSHRTLILTFDNNVGKLAWAAIQATATTAFVVAANRSNARTYDEAVEQIADIFPVAVWGNHTILVYGDAANYNRSLHDYDTGYDKLMAGLKSRYKNVSLRAHIANPLVEDRLYVTNRLFAQGRLYVDPSCVSVIVSARTAEIDPKRGIKKPKDDNITHPMEAVDHAVIELFPRTPRTELTGAHL